MTAMIALFSPLWTRILKWAAQYAFLSGLLGYVGPAVSGLASLIGSIFQAISEIVVALSKSPEGRVVLALAVGAVAFLYLRFHYIEEGKALANPQTVIAPKPCPAPTTLKHKR
jgi:hypothetical protein